MGVSLTDEKSPFSLPLQKGKEGDFLFPCGLLLGA
jgi:hypothetical protein